MSDAITIPQNDFGLSAISFTANEAVNTYDAVYFLVWGSNPTDLEVEGACTVDSTYVCHYTILDGDFPRAGEYKYEIDGRSLSGQTVTGKRSVLSGILTVTESA